MNRRHYRTGLATFAFTLIFAASAPAADRCPPNPSGGSGNSELWTFERRELLDGGSSIPCDCSSPNCYWWRVRRSCVDQSIQGINNLPQGGCDQEKWCDTTPPPDACMVAPSYCEPSGSELCDGLDNNATAGADENCAGECCAGDPSIKCRGECRSTNRSCSAFTGTYTSCGGAPDERCNGRDDNCDGRVDEGCYRGTCATSPEPYTSATGEAVSNDAVTCEQCPAKPVDLGTGGATSEPVTDLVLNDPVLPLRLRRRWVSELADRHLDMGPGPHRPLGEGWALTYFDVLELVSGTHGNGHVVWMTGEGAQVNFDSNGAGTWSRPMGRNDALTYAAGTYTLMRGNGVVLYFSVIGGAAIARLSAVDTGQSRIEIDYFENGTCTTGEFGPTGYPCLAMTTTGRLLKFQWTSINLQERLTAVTSANTNEVLVRYGYDSFSCSGVCSSRGLCCVRDANDDEVERLTYADANPSAFEPLTSVVRGGLNIEQHVWENGRVKWTETTAQHLNIEYFEENGAIKEATVVDHRSNSSYTVALAHGRVTAATPCPTCPGTRRAWTLRGSTAEGLKSSVFRDTAENRYAAVFKRDPHGRPEWVSYNDVDDEIGNAPTTDIPEHASREQKVFFQGGSFATTSLLTARRQAPVIGDWFPDDPDIPARETRWIRGIDGDPTITGIITKGNTVTDAPQHHSDALTGWGNVTASTTISWELNTSPPKITTTGPSGEETVVELWEAGDESNGQVRRVRRKKSAGVYVDTSFGESSDVAACGFALGTKGYDSFGNARTTRDPNGIVSCARHDANGRLTESWFAAETSTPHRRFAYRVDGSLLTSTDENGMTVRTVLVGEETGFAPSFQKGLLRATERWSGAADSSRLLERTEYEYDAKHLMVVERTLAWPTTEGYNCSGDSDCDGARCMPLAPQNLCGVASCSTDADCASGAALCRGGACLKIDAVSEYGYDAERRRTLTGNHRRLTTTGTGSYEGGAKANFGIDGRLSETGDVPVEVNTKHSYDTRGYVTQVERKVGGEYKKVLTYGYDIDGNITSVSHWNWNDAVTPAQTTTYKYDDFGRLTRVSSPDGGTRVYRYDLSDRLVEVYKSGSPSNISIKYTYDFLGRVTSIAIPDRYQWAFVYDEADGGFTSIADCRSGAGSLPSARHGIGRLTGAYFTQAGETWTQISNYRYAYSPRGLMVIEAQKRYPSSCSNVQRMVYDSLYPDRLREIRYPTGRRVLYDYEQTGNGVHEKSLPDRVQVGYAAGLSNVATDIRYTAGGRLARFTHANGLRSENDWALDGSPLRRRVVSGDGANVYLFREVQAWTPDGAPKLLANRNKKHFEHFGYDEDFDRLTDAKVKNAGGALQAAVGHAYTDDTYTFTPNLLGNRETSTPWFGGSYSHAYAANSSRLTKVTPSMLVGDEDIYAYDPLGAITSRKSRTCTPPPFQTCTDNATFAASYDALERMRTAGGNTYSYDYRNLRTRKVSAVNSLPTDFYYDDGGNLLGEIGCASTSSCAYPRPMQEYVYLGSERISVIKSNQNADGSTSDVALYSLHNGLLGEPLRATNSSLEIVWKRDHDPYGAVDSGHYEVDELSNKLEANCYINTGDNGTVRSPGARTLAIKFDAFKTEGGFDRVRIKDTTDVVTFFDKSGNQYDDGLRCCAADAEVPFGSTCTGTCADGSACSGSTAPSSCNASGFFTTGFSIGSDVPIDGLNLTFGPDSCNSAASTSSCSGTLCATCICSGGTCPSSCCGGLCGQNVRLRGVSAVDFKATYSTTALTLNLRLPGQYENSETGLFYNWNRYYDPRLGTYWQMDPLLHRNSSSGPANPIQPYSYADASPIRWTDATGLLVELYCESIPQAYHLARHCYIRTKCDTCESFDVTVELWGPSKENPAYGRPKELPFNPSDPTHGGRKNVEKYPVNPSSSDDCQIEKCIRTQFQDSATKLPRYNPRGPNSNTFAADILSKCGVNGDFPWNAIGSGESGSCL